MPPPLGEPTRRVTIVFFASDVEQMERRYGQGWTEQVRLLLRKNCKQHAKAKDILDEIFEQTMDQADGN